MGLWAQTVGWPEKFILCCPYLKASNLHVQNLWAPDLYAPKGEWTDGSFQYCPNLWDPNMRASDCKGSLGVGSRTLSDLMNSFLLHDSAGSQYVGLQSVSASRLFGRSQIGPTSETADPAVSW